MKEIKATVTTKGQVTIPLEVRKLLGINPHDKVSFVVENGGVRLAPAVSVVARTAGIFKSGKPLLSAEALREVAEQAIADDVVERMGR